MSELRKSRRLMNKWNYSRFEYDPEYCLDVLKENYKMFTRRMNVNEEAWFYMLSDRERAGYAIGNVMKKSDMSFRVLDALCRNYGGTQYNPETKKYDAVYGGYFVVKGYGDVVHKALYGDTKRVVNIIIDEYHRGVEEIFVNSETYSKIVKMVNDKTPGCIEIENNLCSVSEFFNT